MINALTLLFLCQLAGEVLVRTLGITFPGPVLGMGLIFAGLMLAGRSFPALDAVADTLLRNLSLLFVPAAVGVVQQAGLIAQNWVAIAAAIVLSTAATLVVTVYTFLAVARRHHLVALFLKGEAQQLEDRLLVVDEQDARPGLVHRPPPSTTAPSLVATSPRSAARASPGGGTKGRARKPAPIFAATASQPGRSAPG